MKIAALVIVICITGCASTPEEKARWRAVSDVLGALSVAKGGQAPPPVYDYSYAWDLVYLQYNQPVWHCRGIQTGQYAHESKCAWKPKNDFQWPG